MADKMKTPAEQLRITCARSGKTESQKKTLLALGLARVGRVVTQKNNPAIVGMVKSVAHLVTVEELR